jgi:hypothetical protein
VVVTFVLGFLTERTSSLALATAVHEWLDLGVDGGGVYLWAALASVAVWLWIAWTWPKPNPKPIEHSANRALAQT